MVLEVGFLSKLRLRNVRELQSQKFSTRDGKNISLLNIYSTDLLSCCRGQQALTAEQTSKNDNESVAACQTKALLPAWSHYPLQSFTSCGTTIQGAASTSMTSG